MDDDSKLQSVAIPRQFLEKKLDMLQSPRISLMKISPWENIAALKLRETKPSIPVSKWAVLLIFIQRKNTEIQKLKALKSSKASSSATFYHRCRKGWPTSKSSGMPAVVTWQRKKSLESIKWSKRSIVESKTLLQKKLKHSDLPWSGKNLLTLPETNSSPLKIGLLPVKFIFQPLIIDFQRQAVSFREGSTVSPPQILPKKSPKNLYAKSQGTRMKNHKANQLLHVMQVVRHPKIKGRKILPFLPAQKCSQTKKTHREKWMRSPPWEKKNSKMLGGCFWGEVRNLFWMWGLKITLPKTNMAIDNPPFQYAFAIENGDFTASHVSFLGVIFTSLDVTLPLSFLVTYKKISSLKAKLWSYKPWPMGIYTFS